LKHVPAINLDPAVMTLLFGSNIDIRDMVRYKDVMEYGLGLKGVILTMLKGENFFIGTKAALLHHVIIPHHVTNINVGRK